MLVPFLAPLWLHCSSLLHSLFDKLFWCLLKVFTSTCLRYLDIQNVESVSPVCMGCILSQIHLSVKKHNFHKFGDRCSLFFCFFQKELHVFLSVRFLEDLSIAFVCWFLSKNAWRHTFPQGSLLGVPWSLWLAVWYILVAFGHRVGIILIILDHSGTHVGPLCAV